MRLSKDDEKALAALRAIRDHGSISYAVKHTHCSYSTVWTCLQELGRAYGTPLYVSAVQARGSALTDEGAVVLDALEEAAAYVNERNGELERKLARG